MLEHKYGKNVRILNNHYLNGLLAKLCHPHTFQPHINQLTQSLYSQLILTVLENELPRTTFSAETRMTVLHPEQKLETTILDPSQKAVVVNLARAGTWPSHICFELLHTCLMPQNLRQDHIFASRISDEKHRVSGVDFSASKIGGNVEDSFVFIPDPMGATGTTISECIQLYKQKQMGTAKKLIALHLIITPEYIKKITETHPEVLIYSIRLDRGLSPKAVLESLPGTHWEQERGLNENGYIVPGGGGFGEIMNNSFV